MRHRRRHEQRRSRMSMRLDVESETDVPSDETSDSSDCDESRSSDPSPFPTILTRQQSTEIDKKIARFIIFGNHEFDCVEEPDFRDLIKYIAPGYKPMGRKVISDRLVLDLFEEQKSRVKKVCYVTLTVKIKKFCNF